MSRAGVFSEPAKTRDVVGLAPAASLNAPTAEQRWPVFRM